MKNWSIKYKILFLAMFPVAVVAILLSTLVMIGGITEMDDALNSRGMLITRQLAPASEYGAFSGNREILQALAQASMKELDINAIIITDDRNKLLAVSGRPSLFEFKAAGFDGTSQIDSTDKNSRIFSAPIYQNENDIDNYDLFDNPIAKKDQKKKMLGRVYVELSTLSTQQRKRHFIMITIAIGFLGFLSASLLALRIGRDITHPLSQLLNAVAHMSSGNLDTRITVETGGELAELERNFNGMAAKLQSAYNKMQERIEERTKDLAKLKYEAERAKAAAERANQAKTQFLAQIGQNINIPLNDLNGFLELMDKTCLDEAQRDYLKTCETSSLTLQAIANSIHHLSRNEAGEKLDSLSAESEEQELP